MLMTDDLFVRSVNDDRNDEEDDDDDEEDDADDDEEEDDDDDLWMHDLDQTKSKFPLRHLPCLLRMEHVWGPSTGYMHIVFTWEPWSLRTRVFWEQLQSSLLVEDPLKTSSPTTKLHLRKPTWDLQMGAP